jgi:asparagine synthase (glutamine-hydrolysing)
MAQRMRHQEDLTMCGFAGILSSQSISSPDELSATVGLMTDTLQHRGPDDKGTWVDAEVGVALGHRRLSIIDLSPAGHQPMVSACGRYVMVYNGEIYNHRDLRRELEAEFGERAWRGHSDTEVMLAAVVHWGVQGALGRFNGMFAFALWDRKERVLYLSRDRLGEKPLYYGWMGKVFLFGSELKALRAHPAWQGEIDRDALTLLLRFQCVPAPYSIYHGIRKLLPGTLLILPWKDGRSGREDEISTYWSAKEIAAHGLSEPFKGSEAEAIDRLDGLLRNAVKLRMEADVPLGAFLSGGIDSSTVVALMQAQAEKPVKTFSIGYYEEGYNEANYAKAVASHLGTEHTELYVTPRECLEVIPRLPSIYDEPFSDTSQIPTFLVSQLTRQYVTVSLSGDGGDELFGGYTRHFWMETLWQKLAPIPISLRKMLLGLLGILVPICGERFFQTAQGIFPSKYRQANITYQLYKFMELLTAQSIKELYLTITSHWKHPAALVKGASEPPTRVTDWINADFAADFTNRIIYLDLVQYLPDDILVKLDRASMAVSLESRVPYLDHRVVEFAWSLPLPMKIRDGQGKRILRQVLTKYVPNSLTDRPKTGFAIPLDSWLRGSLRDWAEALVDTGRLHREGFFNPAEVREKWNEHQAGKRNWEYYLWDILMFQSWLENQTPKH